MHTWSLPEQVCLPRGLAAVRGSVFILYHPQQPSVERAQRECHAFRQLHGHFDSVSVLIWSGRPFPPPCAEVRSLYAEAFRSGPSVEAVAWVVDTVLGVGRSIVASISAQMFPLGAETRIFHEPFEAAGWLSARAGEGSGDVDAILDGLDALDRATPELA
ncbi:hypothetical protein G6O69_22005 [Pseudenhygromyxa sp. WMMC2535]|uniref:hypothetical protein n=1 Tax=Pseudenhygromyxa sp. WMMC2535 TaxID=2712867 RepID=UPI0015530480|nr:hypothetical protein [Pseudenhygromyxa sp. WMMC2535]NVB40531.1 hypothetical protein [Pseudenhygromyxa sp. WMMC2535]